MSIVRCERVLHLNIHEFVRKFVTKEVKFSLDTFTFAVGTFEGLRTKQADIRKTGKTRQREET